MSQAERFTIAKLRYAGGSEHFVRYVSEVHYDAALAREAALQQRLTAIEQLAVKFEGLLLQTNELLYAIQGDPGAVPSSAIDAMRGEVFTVLKPSVEVEALGTRPVGCCCPPKGHTGIWAAAMCPVHFGLKRPGVSHDQ